MGEIKKCYCDTCKAEFAPATFSRAGEIGETGIIKNSITVSKIAGDDPIEEITATLCDACYDKMVLWLKGKLKASAAAWATEDPAPIVVKLPTL